MEFRELEAFVAVAEELHFGRAAARLHLSQPALSQQIQRLEADLDAVLLHRTSREVSLTAAGAVFLERCRVLLGDVADAVASTRGVAEGRAGRLRIGYVGSTLYGLLPVVVARLRRLHPDLELELVERKTAPQLERLVTGEQDIGVVHRPPTSPTGLVLHDVEEEEVVVALPQAHPLADIDGPLEWGALQDVPFVLFPRELEPDTHDLLVGSAARHGVALDVVQEGTGLPTILGLARAGVGAAFVVAGVATQAAQEGLVFRPLRQPATVTTSVAWDPETRNPAVATFLRVLDPHAGEASSYSPSASARSPSSRT